MSETFSMTIDGEAVDAPSTFGVINPATGERISSQLWHRDYNDKHLLKAFLHLVDVDEDMGPFQYVPESQPGGRYADAWPWSPLGQNYPSEQELEERISRDVADGESLGVSGTPTFYVDGELFQPETVEDFTTVLDEALAE